VLTGFHVRSKLEENFQSTLSFMFQTRNDFYGGFLPEYLLGALGNSFTVLGVAGSNIVFTQGHVYLEMASADFTYKCRRQSERR